MWAKDVCHIYLFLIKTWFYSNIQCVLSEGKYRQISGMTGVVGKGLIEMIGLGFINIQSILIDEKVIREFIENPGLLGQLLYIPIL